MTLTDKLKALDPEKFTVRAPSGEFHFECITPDQYDKLRSIAVILAEACESNMSAHKSGCVEYKNCACWWQNASEAITKAQAMIGGE